MGNPKLLVVCERPMPTAVMEALHKRLTVLQEYGGILQLAGPFRLFQLINCRWEEVAPATEKD